MIALDDVVLRDDLDPRLGERDADLIAQYADIFDALPPIEINQDNEVIDGWHRVRAAERAERTEIAYVVVETTGDDDLSDRMWESNLKHGVQYTRDQRQNHGLKLHKRKLTAQGIAERCGVGVNTVYRWTKELRDKAKGERDQTVIALAEEGTTQQQIADELDLPQKTVSNILLSQNPQMVEMAKDTAEEPSPEEPDPDTAEEPADEKSDIPESVSEEPAIEADEEETGETTEVEKVGERPGRKRTSRKRTSRKKRKPEA